MTSWLVFKRICGGKVNWETNTNIISGPKGPVFLKDLHMTQNKQSWLLLAGLLATGCTGIEWDILWEHENRSVPSSSRLSLVDSN